MKTIRSIMTLTVAALVICSNSTIYAGEEEEYQSPFSSGAISITSNLIEQTQTTTSQTALEKVEKQEKNTDGFPCEGTINCRYGQNCRLSPWGDIIAVIPPGTKVTITAKEGDWYIIDYNGQKAYLHYSLVDTPTTPAYDGYHPYAYADINPNYKKEKPAQSSSKSNSKSNKITKTKTNTNTNTQTTNNRKIDTTKDINGPAVPERLLSGLEAAKKSVWNRTNNKCLQFAGTIAEEAGAKVSKSGAGSQPQIAWAKNKDTSMRGQKISSLKEAALSGKLLPGMLIHVKAHYNEDPDYVSSRPNDGHHWFMYMGLVNGEPMFVDNIKNNQLRNTETQAKTFNTSKYGDRYITTIYDPFADQR